MDSARKLAKALRFAWRLDTLAFAFSVWFAGAAIWGLGALPAAGHLGGGQAGTALFGENILRWKTIYPLWTWYSTHAPGLDQAYCHHPFGVHWLSALSVAMFGHRDLAVALPAVTMSVLSPYLMYRVAKLHWGTAAGVVALAAFTVVPINVAFSSYHNLEVMGIFGLLVFFLGHGLYLQTLKTRHLVLALFGVLVTVCSDWIGYVGLGVVLGYDLIRLWILPGKTGGFRQLKAHGRLWILSATIAVVSFVGWLVLFQHAGKMGDWLGSAEARGSREATSFTATLSAVLASRRAWIDTAFTPLAITLGKVAAITAIVRPLVRRVSQEVFPLALLLVATMQYVAFRQGAEVHYFWPHYFGAYYALALAGLFRTLLDISGRLPGAFIKRHQARITAALVGLALLPSFIMLPDAFRMRRYAWATGGRFNEHGSHVRSERFYFQVLREKTSLPLGTPLLVHPTAGWGGWEGIWAIHGAGEVNATPRSDRPYWAARGNILPPDEQKRLGAIPGMSLYAGVWLYDRRRNAPLTAWKVREREPTAWERFWSHPTERAFDITDEVDLFATWEARFHFGLQAEAPSEPARTDEEKRIAHNIAVSRGDEAAAAVLREALTAHLSRSSAALFNDGLQILGTHVIAGAEPRVEVWFLGAPTQADAVFNVYSKVLSQDPLSLIPADGTMCGYGETFAISTKLWRKGFLYKLAVPLHHRPGTERYWAMWGTRDGARAPVRLDGATETELAIVR